jgi:glycosyltransferase involved in cell wall biosynthesis
MKTKVSILMTVFNAENFVVKSVKSIINQTFKNWELVIIDDFSSDESLRLISSIKNKKIKVFKLKKHMGRTKALNYGLNKCKGKYIAILDSDDFSKKDRIKKQFNFLENNSQFHMVGSWYKKKSLKQNNQVIKPNITNKLFKKHLMINPISHSSIMYLRKKAFSLGKYPNKLKYAQDWGLILKFLKYSRVKILPYYLTDITVNLKSMTFSDKYKKIIINDNIENLNYVKNNFDISFIELFVINIILLKIKTKLLFALVQ